MNQSQPAYATSFPSKTSISHGFTNFIGWLALTCLLLTPLIFDPGAHDDAYLTPKWAWITTAAALGGVALIARFFSGRPIMFPFDEVWVAALVFLIWNWIAVLWAESRSLAFDRAFHLSCVTLALWTALHWLRTRRMLLRLAWGYLIIAAIIAVWILIEDYVRAFWPHRTWIQPNLPDWRGFLAAGLGNTNHLGDLLALAMLPALIMFGETRRAPVKGLLGALLVLYAAALIVCYSVGSNLGLIIGAALMLIMVLWKFGQRWFLRRWPRWVSLIFIWSALIIYFNADIAANPHRPGILKQGFGSERWHEGGATRLTIWAEALEMVRLHPFRGVGAGNFTYVFPEMDSKLIAHRPDLLMYQGMWTNAAHNELLQSWAELGIGGFILIMLCGVAFYHLFRNIGAADPLGFRLRMALAGLLGCYCAQAQMNFTLQHPTGVLTFYGILLAIIVEKRTRPRVGGFMPPLRWETDWLALQVDWHSMKKPTGLGAALLIPSAISIAIIALLLGCWLWLTAQFVRPVLAQREYHKGVAAERLGDAATAEAHFKRAFALYPNATDCRSHYSQWLVDQQRPKDALTELEIVRERLNSNELWLREAQAYDQLGLPESAEKARELARARVWRLQGS